ncbi:hypothetical protein PI124_g24252 [Phytophthora idaei]|nr:hypothetical protein PI124_g24252 [Phytophthora idaei]
MYWLVYISDLQGPVCPGARAELGSSGPPERSFTVLSSRRISNTTTGAATREQSVTIVNGLYGLPVYEQPREEEEEEETRKIVKGSTTVPATPSKSGGALYESSSPDVTAARLAAVSELSVSFEDEEEHGSDAQDDYDDYEDKTPAAEPGAVTPETATPSPGLSGATKSLSGNLSAELDDVAGSGPNYDDFNDGTEGSKPSVASAKRSALLNAPLPPINGDTPAAKRVFDRVEALMRNDEWMQLFKPIPKRKADWPALANELQYPVNSVSTSQVAED